MGAGRGGEGGRLFECEGEGWGGGGGRGWGGGGRLLIFSVFWMGAYSRWALFRINTVSCQK